MADNIVKTLQEITKEELERRVLDICYSREMCRSLGINYDDIRDKDIQTIREYLTKNFYHVFGEK